MSTETTYTAQETTEAAAFVAGIVLEARRRADEARELEEAQTRAAVEKAEAERMEARELIRASLPEAIRPFADAEAIGNQLYRAVISLPGCAPFGVGMAGGAFSQTEPASAGSALSNYFYPAIASIDESNEYEPTLEMSRSHTRSTLEKEIARAYEADSRYRRALALYKLTQAEREHAEQMSERESALRHEEEPEPPALVLSEMTSDEILRMAASSIAAAEEAFSVEYLPPEKRAAYHLMRANALTNYVKAHFAGYLPAIANNA